MPRGEEYPERMLRKKVASEGQEWVERLETKREEDLFREQSGLISRQNIFGSEVLSSWEFVNQRGKRWEEMPEVIRENEIRRYQKKFNSSIERVNEQLQEMSHNDPMALLKFLSDNLPDQNLEKSAKKLGLRKTDYQTPDHILVLVETVQGRKSNLTEKEMETLRRKAETYRIGRAISKMYSDGERLPDEVLLSILERHRVNVLLAEKEMEPEIAVFKERVSNLLFEAIDRGDLPISTALVEERLNNLQFRAVDPMSARLEEKWGDYNAKSHTIRLSTDIPKKSRWAVFVHEVFHALSGQIDNMNTLQGFEEDPLVTGYDSIKVGTRFHDRFRWLNEALTEEATRGFTNESWGYENERELLDILVSSGVSKESLYGAYFENYTDKPEGSHRLPKTKALFDTINQRLGQGFLINLDGYIRFSTKKRQQDGGVKSVVAKWRKLGDGFPKFVNDWSNKETAKMREKYKQRHDKKRNKKK